METGTLATLERLAIGTIDDVSSFADILLSTHAFYQYETAKAVGYLQSYYSNPSDFQSVYEYWQSHNAPMLGSDEWQGFVDYFTNFLSTLPTS